MIWRCRSDPIKFSMPYVQSDRRSDPNTVRKLITRKKYMSILTLNAQNGHAVLRFLNMRQLVNQSAS